MSARRDVTFAVTEYPISERQACRLLEMDAKCKIERWRMEYNRERPHSSLGYRTPEEYAKTQVTTSLPGQGTTMLPDGSVLALGGNSISGVVSRATVDGAAIRATLLGVRAWHSATALPDGTVLIVGGIDARDRFQAETFDPKAQTFTDARSSISPRAARSATF